MTTALAPCKLEWTAYWQWDGEPEIGGIYTQEVTFYTDDNYRFTVSFRVGEGRSARSDPDFKRYFESIRS